MKKTVIALVLVLSPAGVCAHDLDGLWASVKFDPCDDGDGIGHIYIDAKARTFDAYEIHCKNITIGPHSISSKDCAVEYKKQHYSVKYELKPGYLVLDGDRHHFCYSIADNAKIRALMKKGASYKDAYDRIVRDQK